MSFLVSKEEFNMGLSLIHSRIRDAIDEYEQFLLTFGTVPSMNLVGELKEKADEILDFDGENARPFKHEVTERERLR